MSTEKRALTYTVYSDNFYYTEERKLLSILSLFQLLGLFGMQIYFPKEALEKSACNETKSQLLAELVILISLPVYEVECDFVYHYAAVLPSLIMFSFSPSALHL